MPEALEELLFEALFERQQGVEGAVPALQLEGLHTHAGGLGSLPFGIRAVGGHEPAASRIAGEVAAQPVGQGVFGARGGEAVGDQDQHAVRERAEQLGQAEFLPQAAQGEEGAVAERAQGGRLGGVGLLAAAEFKEAFEVRFELVGAAEGGDDAASGAAVLPDRLTQADVFVGAATGAGLSGHEVHRMLPIRW